MALNRYLFTLEGSKFPDGTGSVKTVTIWVAGPEDGAEFVGESRKHAGYVTNDSGLLAFSWKLKLVPFSLVNGGMEGHDNTVYLKLLQVLSSRYKAIVAVSGPNIIGLDGTTQYWAQLLTRFSGRIPITVKGINTQLPYNNTREATLDLVCRYPGVDLP
jgi:hypothetical protein